MERNYVLHQLLSDMYPVTEECGCVRQNTFKIEMKHI